MVDQVLRLWQRGVTAGILTSSLSSTAEKYTVRVGVALINTVFCFVHQKLLLGLKNHFLLFRLNKEVVQKSPEGVVHIVFATVALGMGVNMESVTKRYSRLLVKIGPHLMESSNSPCCSL